MLMFGFPCGLFFDHYFIPQCVLHITKACIKSSPINDFIGGKFLSFCEKYFEKECSIKNSTLK